MQVAKKLGKGKPDCAKQGFMAVSACIVLLCGLMAAATFVFRHSIAAVYSQVVTRLIADTSQHHVCYVTHPRLNLPADGYLRIVQLGFL